MGNLVGDSLVSPAQYAKLSQSIPRSGAVLEIGTWHGVTAAKLADDHPDALIVSVDPFIGWTGAPCDPNFYLRNKRPNMRGFIGTVQQLVPLWNCDLRFDVVLVDAVHKYPDALNDMIGAWAVTHQDHGRIFAHDYDEAEFPGVVQSVTEFCAMTATRVLSRTDERRSLVEMARG